MIVWICWQVTTVRSGVFVIHRPDQLLYRVVTTSEQGSGIAKPQPTELSSLTLFICVHSNQLFYWLDFSNKISLTGLLWNPTSLDFHTSVYWNLKIENFTILILKGNSYCCRKSSARGPRFKVSSEGLSAEIDIPQRSPIQVQTKVKVA